MSAVSFGNVSLLILECWVLLNTISVMDNQEKNITGRFSLFLYSPYLSLYLCVFSLCAFVSLCIKFRGFNNMSDFITQTGINLAPGTLQCRAENKLNVHVFTLCVSLSIL